MASSKNIFIWFCGVLICQRGLIPRRTRPCGVSDPAEQDPAGYQTPQNKVLRGIRPRPRRAMADLCTFYSIHLFWGGWYPAEQCPAGSDTLLNKVLRGIKPRRTTFRNEYFCEFEKKIQNCFKVWIRGLYGVDSWKKPEIKISCYCPFNWTPMGCWVFDSRWII